MTGEKFRAAVERVHAKHTGSESTHGALTWFGDWCHKRTGRAVFDWTALDEVPKGPHLVVLALLEAAPAGSRTLREVERVLGEWGVG